MFFLEYILLHLAPDEHIKPGQGIPDLPALGRINEAFVPDVFLLNFFLSSRFSIASLTCLSDIPILHPISAREMVGSFLTNSSTRFIRSSISSLFLSGLFSGLYFCPFPKKNDLFSPAEESR